MNQYNPNSDSSCWKCEFCETINQVYDLNCSFCYVYKQTSQMKAIADTSSTRKYTSNTSILASKLTKYMNDRLLNPDANPLPSLSIEKAGKLFGSKKTHKSKTTFFLGEESCCSDLRGKYLLP